MGAWASRLQSGQATWIAASLALHVSVGGLLLWVNPLGGRHLAAIDTVAIEIITLPPPVIEEPPASRPTPPPEKVPTPKRRRDPAPSPPRPPPLSQLNILTAPDEQPANSAPRDMLVPAEPLSSVPQSGGVTLGTRRALAGIFCNRMNEDERDAAGCPLRAALPRHLQDDPHPQVWQPRQPLQDIYESQLAANVSQNYLERQLTPQGAPQTMPGGMSAIDNTVFMDRPSDAEMDARNIENGGRPDWTAAIEKAHGR